MARHTNDTPQSLPTLSASDEVVSARASVGDGVLEVAVRVKDDAVRAGRATRIDRARAQDGELVPRARVGEVEAFVVVVLMGVVAAAYIVRLH